MRHGPWAEARRDAHPASPASTAPLYLIQDEEGQITEPHSISAGLDYPGIGPEHSFLKDFGRAEHHAVTDQEARRLCPRLRSEASFLKGRDVPRVRLPREAHAHPQEGPEAGHQLLRSWRQGCEHR